MLRQAARNGSRAALAAFGLPADDKTAFAVGLGASHSAESEGAMRGEPADAGRRQRSVVDRAFQRNEDDFATSSMPEPGSVSP